MGVITATVRPARPGDAEGLGEIHEAAWRHSYDGLIPHQVLRGMIDRRRGRWWERAAGRAEGLLVLEFGTHLVGYASYGRNRAPTLPCEGEIYELYVRPEYQGTGMGGRLFVAAGDELKAQRLRGTVVWALEENHNACTVYERWGGLATARGTERFGALTLSKLAFLWR